MPVWQSGKCSDWSCDSDGETGGSILALNIKFFTTSCPKISLSHSLLRLCLDCLDFTRTFLLKLLGLVLWLGLLGIPSSPNGVCLESVRTTRTLLGFHSES